VPRTDKRERLVESAKALFHERGVATTSLADIAQRAVVPLGNVYYYFKTKDDLVSSVVACRADEVRQLLERLDRKRTPQARLKGLGQQWADASEMVARHGCPIGGLCAEVDKLNDGSKGRPDAPLALLVGWAEEQLRQLGRPDARELSYSVVARIQGACLLAQDFDDPQILVREARLFARWVDDLAGGRAGARRSRP
jgi:AcrR family transcriptional regulator